MRLTSADIKEYQSRRDTLNPFTAETFKELAGELREKYGLTEKEAMDILNKKEDEIKKILERQGTDQAESSNQVSHEILNSSEQFMNMVMKEFSSGVGELALTDFQKRLAQNYFISLDATLKLAEEKRKKKNEKYRDPLPIAWANINLETLARNVVSKARVGLDPIQKNHVAMMPFKNNTLNKYDIVFIDGYRGIELTSKKYGLDVPDIVIVELVYTKDKFKSYKKDRNNKIETFDFEVVDEFDRGTIRGGFYYHAYPDNPEKNKLVVFTLKDILKRKPAYAGVEFWGGVKDVWKDGKKAGTETVEGWYEKMCWKTIYRAAYGDITIDSQKIDDDYIRLREMEATLADARVAQEIAENANTEPIDVNFAVVGEENEPGESEEPPAPPPPGNGQAGLFGNQPAGEPGF